MVKVDYDPDGILKLTRSVSTRNSILDPTFSPPERSGSSDVLEKYCATLAELLATIDAYKDLVIEDMRMVDSVVKEMLAKDVEMSDLLRQTTSQSTPRQGG